ncbi:penicillin-binding transpeptidase domain-containing protein [Dysosmobacter sp.]|uniref:penicillin-binding transpeptidase domain-containing protein n=1 Tax=Dysosmobacter sp. TaxID=2591382 RepID=UPI002A859DC6|nr:penicillin-binding transpeptidase domain-containing protein [Dysosmobacter sp.]MDY3984401.1 penicillin-binding transpeptidase domain-containing protein [Dysosmobacter sp.]
MANTPRRKSDAARRANQVIRTRTVLMMVLLGVVTFILLFWKLYDLQINQHEKLQADAVKQQTSSSVVTASRGTVYDRNGSTVAISATAETVILSPKDISDHAETQDPEYVARGLGRILEVDPATILEKMEKTWSQYEIIKKRVDQEVADQVRAFLNGWIDDAGSELTEENENGERVLRSDHTKKPTRLYGIYLQPDSKRYYPYGTLASNVLGYVNGDNIGGVGLEAKYDSTLKGTSGLTVTAKNARGSDLLYQYEQYYDAENGKNLVLTLDVNVQYYLEKGLESMVSKFGAKNGATGIVMEVNTGAIVAMASYPNYDLNDYATIYDETLREKMETELAELEKNRSSYATEEEYDEAVAKVKGTYRNTQWRNKCIDSTYEPGSTFKPLTLAAALEEGVVNMNTTFTCTGSVRVQGWGKPIYCSNHNGHGTQDLKTATGNSCNPAFISMGLKIGTDKYYDYLEAFGLMEPTGVDMIGEVTGIFSSRESFNSNVVSLASYAFGQTFTTTPLHLIRAQAACINGGYLYEPYVVAQVLDDDGNIVEQHDTTPIRQVISEETSAKVRECLEYVVASGTGRNGQVAGYRIGGKTGTADKTGNKDREIVVSFMCFAPADDPQYIMLLTMDTPRRDTGTYPSGGNMVAPTASQIMSEILPYLGIEPDYTAEELVGADANVPNVVGMSLEDAKARLESAGFPYKTVGDGGEVTDQTPAGGAIVPNNADIILYMGEEKPDTPATVPNVVGMTAAEANKAITNAGLIMKVTGATSSSSGNVHAISQSAAAGAQLERGSVVTVQFGSQSSGAD